MVRTATHVGGNWLRIVANNRLCRKDAHHIVVCVERTGQSVASFASAAEQMPKASGNQVLPIICLRQTLGLKAPP